MLVLVEMSSVRKHVILFFRHRDEIQHWGMIGSYERDIENSYSGMGRRMVWDWRASSKKPNIHD